MMNIQDVPKERLLDAVEAVMEVAQALDEAAEERGWASKLASATLKAAAHDIRANVQAALEGK